ncbi:unnamed protein product [Rotaria magnacalcarata]|uniref:Ionotropic glutamate receptor C-terminal domain-containing protein n=2 Tax=Rotaria magnacalcarata TaxID=392030 RepID=A0A816VK94_9BILA|nr:unnamed protein product [Rotaria magnacalcarata]CAF1619754.1 unnamed protein product [Rotaria magnacalcarata]CAF2106832.1 unnamed protein product [Rotaria magnacalcarata]CAF2128603.1 unnamed protein product [Rotaria magnacalcarata]CAF2156995.1 unnamed protein product [Rotaria magnacalcarata]
MPRFLFLLICVALSIDILNGVRILGLFPEQGDALSHNSSVSLSDHWTNQCMQMFLAAISLSNRYEIYVGGQHINYTILNTNIESNGFAELELVCRTMCNRTGSDIVGVVGPASSTKVRYLGPFAARIHLPLISYAATNADLDDTYNYATFYRTIPSDTLLAEAIVQLFTFFSWTSCIIIVGKDDYGYGGLKILSEVYHSDLSIQDRLIFDLRLDKFHANLTETLEKSRSRIVLVWACQNSTTRIIHHALTNGLIGGNYVWIMTSKIDFNVFKQYDLTKLAGVLAVVHIIGNSSTSGVNETLQKEAFDAWRNLSYEKKKVPEQLSDVSPFAMYTFDATWALIQALNKSSIDKKSPSMYKASSCFDSLLQNYTTYFDYLQTTRFFGVSGIVDFSKNDLNENNHGGMYVLYSVQSKTNHKRKEVINKEIMTWHETSHSWTNYTNPDKLNITWPRNPIGKVPTDYPQLQGQHLRILVIEAPPFVIIHNFSNQGHFPNNINNVEHNSFRCEPLKTTNPSILIYGFVPDLIRLLQSQMHFNFTIDVANLSTNYHSLVALVANDNRQYDIILSDIRITSSRLLKVDFSTPYHENTFRIISRSNPYSTSFSLFSCFNPFTWDVWAAIFAIIIYSGFIIYIFERHNIKIEHCESEFKSILIGICHAMTSILIMNGDIRLSTNSSRITVLGLYALGIILVATYTANLSSFLTLNRSQATISGIDDIKNGRLPFSRIGIVTNSAVSDYYIQNISTEYHALSTIEEMYSRLLDHTIDASIWDSSVLEYAVNNYYCDKLIIAGVGFVKSSFAIVLPKNWLYKRDLDLHILALRETQKLESLENAWLRHRTCPSSSSSSANHENKEDSSKTETFSLDVLGGLFLTFLITTAIAFCFHLWHCRVAIINGFRQTKKRMHLSTIQMTIKS